MRTRTTTRRYTALAAYVALTSFCVNTLAFGLLIEMAVFVAQGNKLHVGADILFANFTSAQLCVMACTAGAIALASALAGLVAGIMAER